MRRMSVCTGAANWYPSYIPCKLASSSRWVGRESIGRDRSPFTMRIGAGLTARQLASLSWSRTTPWTTNCENLFGGRFFCHSRKRRPKVCVTSCSVLTRKRPKCDARRG